jgi:hypothetical protein
MIRDLTWLEGYAERGKESCKGDHNVLRSLYAGQACGYRIAIKLMEKELEELANGIS